MIALSLTIFYALYAAGYCFPNDLNVFHYKLLNLPSWIALTALILSLALLYETAMSRTLAELETADARLQREKDFSDSAIASLPGNFYVFDEQGRFVQWNQNFEQVSEYLPEEISRMHPLEFFRGQDRDAIEQGIQEAFTKGWATMEACLVTRSGTVIPYLFSGRRVVIDGRLHVVGMGIDITDRKRAKAAARESRHRAVRQRNAAAALAVDKAIASGDVPQPYAR